MEDEINWRIAQPPTWYKLLVFVNKYGSRRRTKAYLKKNPKASRCLEQARKKKRTRDWITSYDANFV